MNVHPSYPSAFDGMNWTSMPPPPGPHVGGAPFTPLPGQQYEYDYQQQHQLPTHYRPTPSYPLAPPHAPHLAQRNYYPHKPYYPPPFFVEHSSASAYPLPSPPATFPYYPQQIQHGFAYPAPPSHALPPGLGPPPMMTPFMTSYDYQHQQLQISGSATIYPTPPRYVSQEQQHHFALFGNDGVAPAHRQQAYQIGVGLDNLNLNSNTSHSTTRGDSVSQSRSRGRGCWTEAEMIATSQSGNASSAIWTDERVGHPYAWPVEKRGRSLTGSVSQPQPGQQTFHQQSQQTSVQPGFVRVNNQDHDHPSFDRPPHRGNSVGSVSMSQRSSRTNLAQPQPIQQPTPASSSTLAAARRPSLVDPATSSKKPGQEVIYDLISNESSVPPPPSLEFSAVCLADLATEMVWEACSFAVAASVSSTTESGEILPASAMERWTRTLTLLSRREERRSSSPGTPELFGAIGEGRSSQRKKVNDGAGSDFSSPSSGSEPQTPDGDSSDGNESRRRERLVGLGCGIGFGAEHRADNLDHAVDVVRNHARKMSQSTRTGQTVVASGTAAFPLEASPAFRQFVKQVLTATLLAPEDLLLALYFVAKVPSSSFIQFEGCTTAAGKASAIKAAPFKVILGALMLANKTLQDNSYRNETFASVSGIPLKDVTELEIYLFTSLNFNVGTNDTVWSSWVGTVLARLKRSSAHHNFEGEKSLARLVAAAKESEGVKTSPPTPVHTCSPTGSPPTMFVDLEEDNFESGEVEEDGSEESDEEDEREVEEEDEGPLRVDQRGRWTDTRLASGGRLGHEMKLTPSNSTSGTASLDSSMLSFTSAAHPLPMLVAVG